MPIRGAKTIKDLIYYQYAKIIAQSEIKSFEFLVKKRSVKENKDRRII